MRLTRYLPFMITLASTLAVLAIFAFSECSVAAVALPRPHSISVQEGGVEAAEYLDGDEGFEALYSSLKYTQLTNVLETTIDDDAVLAGCDSVLFSYARVQKTRAREQTPSREYDALLFLLSGPDAGQVVLGLNGSYLPGTYDAPAAMT